MGMGNLMPGGMAAWAESMGGQHGGRPGASPRAWTPGGMAIWRHAGHETPRPLELAAFQPSRQDRQ